MTQGFFIAGDSGQFHQHVPCSKSCALSRVSETALLCIKYYSIPCCQIDSCYHGDSGPTAIADQSRPRICVEEEKGDLHDNISHG